jgi:hypothetical protein
VDRRGVDAAVAQAAVLKAKADSTAAAAPRLPAPGGQ